MDTRLTTTLQALFLFFASVPIFAMPLVIQSGTTDQSAGPIIVLASPWHDPTQAIIQAGGYPVGPTRAIFGMFAASDEPAFRDKIYAAGHWTINSQILADIFCKGL